MTNVAAIMIGQQLKSGCTIRAFSRSDLALNCRGIARKAILRGDFLCLRYAYSKWRSQGAIANILI